jgi:hypothetical protein
LSHCLPYIYAMYVDTARIPAMQRCKMFIWALPPPPPADIKYTK